MSWWTDFRDEVLVKNKVSTPQEVAKTVGGIFRSEDPEPSQVIPSSPAPVAVLAGMSPLQIAAVGLAIYLVIRRL